MPGQNCKNTLLQWRACASLVARRHQAGNHCNSLFSTRCATLCVNRTRTPAMRPRAGHRCLAARLVRVIGPVAQAFIFVFHRWYALAHMWTIPQNPRGISA
jgi:hypothetical protein